MKYDVGVDRATDMSVNLPGTLVINIVSNTFDLSVIQVRVNYGYP